MPTAPQDIQDEDSAHVWLRGQSEDVQRIIGLRSALRVWPLVTQVFDDDISLETQRSLMLQSLRANLISSVASISLTDEMNLAAADATTAVTASVVAVNPLAAGGPAGANAVGAAVVAVGSGRADTAVVSAAGIASAALATSIDGASLDTVAAVPWAQIKKDAVWVSLEGVDALYSTGLFWPLNWDDGRYSLQKVVSHQLTVFEHSSEFIEGKWGLWIAWYRNLLSVTPESLFGHQKDKEIALLPPSFWEGRDAAEVNADLEKMVGWPWGEEPATMREDPDEGPSLPAEKGPLPKLIAKDGKLDAVLNAPTQQDLDDPHQGRLMERIKARFSELLNSEGNWLAQYPQLDKVLSDYDQLLRTNELESLDVYELWERGTALISMARQFAAIDPNQQTTKPLEPEQAAILGEVARLHGAFVMGFAAGRYWAERSGFPLLTPAEFRKLLENERTIVRWLLENDQFAMTDRARAAFEQLDYNLSLAGVNAEQLAVLGYPLVRSVIMFGARTLGTAKTVAEDVGLLGLPAHLAVVGLLTFMRENSAPLFDIVASQDELRLYLEYHYRRLGIDFKDRNDEDNTKGEGGDSGGSA